MDTCAAEFKSFTPVYVFFLSKGNFSSYTEYESDPSSKNKIIILGGAQTELVKVSSLIIAVAKLVFALKEAKYETIMVNCNRDCVNRLRYE